MKRSDWLYVLAIPVTSAMGLLLACTQRETAKDAYDLQSHACLVAFTAKADQLDCIAKVRKRYDEAGAPPAAVDGGSGQ